MINPKDFWFTPPACHNEGSKMPLPDSVLSLYQDLCKSFGFGPTNIRLYFMGALLRPDDENGEHDYYVDWNTGQLYLRQSYAEPPNMCIVYPIAPWTGVVGG